MNSREIDGFFSELDMSINCVSVLCDCPWSFYIKFEEQDCLAPEADDSESTDQSVGKEKNGTDSDFGHLICFGFIFVLCEQKNGNQFKKAVYESTKKRVNQYKYIIYS